MIMTVPEPPIVLTIAGSDSGGAAGLQADLRTFAALAVYGLSVVTVVTAQDSTAVTGVHPLPPAFVAAQLDAVLADYGAVAAKTGFIGSAGTTAIIAQRLASYGLPSLVVDPVLVDHRGTPMFPEAVTTAYRERLLPLATLITPNWHEAALLADLPVATATDLVTVVTRLAALGPAAVLCTGFVAGDEVIDIWSDGRQVQQWRSPRIVTTNTHGAGDTLAAAICAQLARGTDLETAVKRGRHFTSEAIARAAHWRLGQGHGPVWQIA